MYEIAREDIERWPRAEPFSLWPRMQTITLRVITRAVFGISDTARLAEVEERLRTLLNRMTNPRWLLAQTLRAATIGRASDDLPPAARALIDPVDELLYDEIRTRRGAEDLDTREDILSMLLRARYDDGSAMTDEELRDELVTLLI